MLFSNKQKPLIVILGPTAVGKTEVSLNLVERLDGEIVSADSRLFYRGMDIGTAKPSQDDQDRIPHHLIDVTEPDQVWSLAKFQRAAFEAINNIQARGKLPFLVGGTGQYIWAVVEGWNIPVVKPDSHLRVALQNWAGEIGPRGLYDRLVVLDPKAANRIDPQNLRRSIRALEVIFQTGNRFSSQRRMSGSPYRTFMLGISRPREELYARVDARIQDMLDTGLVDEVRGLLANGYPSDSPPFSAIGYRQIIDFLKGEITLNEAIILMKRNTRQFVRRQANWFKLDDPRISWFQVTPNIVNEMEAAIRQRFDEWFSNLISVNYGSK
jgi:tRNA dimethylallyltransferase